MTESTPQAPRLCTSTGEFPLYEYCLRVSGREWSVLHTGAVLSLAEEADYLHEMADRLPYGVALWPAALALAHEVAARAEKFRGKTVLELGAGTGLPGIVAASVGAQVVQSDGHEVALAVCRRNGERNDVSGIEYRRVSWSDWEDEEQFAWILGSDILYGEAMHPHLRRIFETNLAPGGRVLLSDPFRAVSLRLLEVLEAQGWGIVLSKWKVGEEAAPRPIGVYELAPPAEPGVTAADAATA